LNCQKVANAKVEVGERIIDDKDRVVALGERAMKTASHIVLPEQINYSINQSDHKRYPHP
jgi:hypothetical protein